MLVPIKIKITHEGGQNRYPRFNDLPSELRGGLDWCHFIDRIGIGMHYDKISGFGQVDAVNNDPNIQYAATCVPEEFALAAVEMFPELVSIILEAEFEEFYNTRAHAHEETEILDVDVLTGILARIQLEAHPNAPTAAPSPEILELRRKCLDPNEMGHRGIRKNPKKTWASFKQHANISIKPA